MLHGNIAVNPHGIMQKWQEVYPGLHPLTFFNPSPPVKSSSGDKQIFPQLCLALFRQFHASIILLLMPVLLLILVGKNRQTGKLVHLQDNKSEDDNALPPHFSVPVMQITVLPALRSIRFLMTELTFRYVK
jgi:hypothetical protein